MNDRDSHVEPVVILLFLGMLFFTGILIFCDKFFPMDGQIFQVVASLLSGFSGAFFMRIKPKNTIEDNPPGTTTVTATPPATTTTTVVTPTE